MSNHIKTCVSRKNDLCVIAQLLYLLLVWCIGLESQRFCDTDRNCMFVIFITFFDSVTFARTRVLNIDVLVCHGRAWRRMCAYGEVTEAWINTDAYE